MRKFFVRLFVPLFITLSTAGMGSQPALADLDTGLMAYASGDFETAAREFGLLSEKGEKAGLYHMGLLYEEGQGVAKQFDRAVTCYTKAAQQGYVDAYFALGEIYLHQPGGQKDRIKAYYWLGMAAKHGHPRGTEEFQRNKQAMSLEQIEIAEKAVQAEPK